MSDDHKIRMSALQDDIKRMAVVTPADCTALAKRHGTTSRVVVAKAAAFGNYSKDGTPPSRLGSNQPDQYGVLQPAANLGAGCLSSWLWLVVIVAVIAGVVALWQTLFG